MAAVVPENEKLPNKASSSIFQAGEGYAACFLSKNFRIGAPFSRRDRCRGLTRPVNAYSKKLQNLRAAISLHFMHYNFVSMHGTIKTTPAIAAGIADRAWIIEDLLPI